MKAPQVWINDELIDTDGNPLKLQRANSLFDGEPIKGEYSYPFTWPLTERNRKLLGNPQEFGLLDEPLIFKARYMSLGELVDGLLYVDIITWDSNAQTGTIQGNLNGTEGILANAFGMKKLSDLKYGGVISLPDSPVRTGIDSLPSVGPPPPISGGGVPIKSRACEFATGVTNGTYTGYPFFFPMIKWLDYRDRATWESFHAPETVPDAHYWEKDSIIELPNDCVNYWANNNVIFGTTEFYSAQGAYVGCWSGPYHDHLSSNFAYAAACYPMMMTQTDSYPFGSGSGGREADTLNRIIPMFKTKWLLTQIFAEVGYALDGTILDDPSFEKLFVLNNYSINRWVLTDWNLSPTIVIEDTCDSINPSNHVPDMKVIDFLNQIFSWLGLNMKTGAGKVTLYTINEILAMNDYPIACPRAPQVIKTLTDTYSTGLSMTYTWTKLTAASNLGAGREISDNLSRAGSLVQQLPTPVSFIEVANHAALPAPSPDNIDQVALVVNEQAYYQNAQGVWTLYGQNLVDHIEDNSKDRVINGSPLPMITESWRENSVDPLTPDFPFSHDLTFRLPVILAPGSYRTDTYINYEYSAGNTSPITGRVAFEFLNQHGKDKFNSFPLHMLFYHGMMGLTTAGSPQTIPFSSPYQIDPNQNIIGPWDLALEGTRSLYAHFFALWNSIVKRLVKYTVVLYPELTDRMATDLHSPKSLLQQRMIPYSATYYEPFDGQVSMDVYKVKDIAPNIITALSLAFGCDRDIYGYYELTLIGSSVSGGSGTYVWHIGYSADSSVQNVYGPSTGAIMATSIFRAADYGTTVSAYLSDDTNKVKSNLVRITLPNPNTSGSIVLTLASSGGNLILTGTTMTGTSGHYRLEVRNASNVIISLYSWVGTMPSSISLIVLMLTAGTTYHFTLYDSSLIISNDVTLTV